MYVHTICSHNYWFYIDIHAQSNITFTVPGNTVGVKIKFRFRLLRTLQRRYPQSRTVSAFNVNEVGPRDNHLFLLDNNVIVVDVPHNKGLFGWFGSHLVTMREEMIHPSQIPVKNRNSKYTACVAGQQLCKLSLFHGKKAPFITQHWHTSVQKGVLTCAKLPAVSDNHCCQFNMHTPWHGRQTSQAKLP